jgi:hypothetical protein
MPQWYNSSFQWYNPSFRVMPLGHKLGRKTIMTRLMPLGHNPSTRLMPLGHKVSVYGSNDDEIIFFEFFFFFL